MSNDAEHLEALLAEYVDGQLDASSAKLVEEHLAKNPATRAAVEQMKLDRDAVRALPRVTAPADMSEDLRGRLERDLLLSIDPVGPQKSRRFAPRLVAIAAVLAIGISVVSVSYELLGNRPQTSLDVTFRDPASTPASPESDDAKAKSAADGASPEGEAPASKSMRASMRPPPKEEPVAQPMTNAEPPAASVAQAPATDAVADKGDAPAPSMAALDAAAPLPAGPSAEVTPGAAAGGAAAPSDVLGNGAKAATDLAATPPAPISAVQAAPAQPAVPPKLAVSNEMLPADAATAVAGRMLNPQRRSVVVVVDSRHVFEAFTIVSQFADRDAHGLELANKSEASRSAAQLMNQNQMMPTADLAAIARGLPESAASSIQSELRRVDANEGNAFELIPEQTQLEDRDRLGATATTHPTTKDAATSFLPTTRALELSTTMPADEQKLGELPPLIDLYVVVRQSMPATQPTTAPATRPTSMPAK